MRGDDRVRHCDHCDRKVFNLSRLSAADALSLLETNGYNVCVRLYKRRDGTVIRGDIALGDAGARKDHALGVGDRDRLGSAGGSASSGFRALFRRRFA